MGAYIYKNKIKEALFRQFEPVNLFVMVFVKLLRTMGPLFYPYGIKSRTLRRYSGRFGPGSFRSGHFGHSISANLFVVSVLIGGSFRPEF